MSDRVIEILIDGEPADQRTLELLERGIDTLIKTWDTAYETISDELPSTSFISKPMLDHVVYHRDELQRLGNDLNDTLNRQVTARVLGRA